jgi:hypothetical protein
MPKKIRRSNNRLKKTNRKGRITANRNRLRKLVGGAKHWVDRLQEHHTIATMQRTLETLEQVKNDVLLPKFEPEFHYTAANAMNELHAYLNGLIKKYTQWEREHPPQAADRPAQAAQAAEHRIHTLAQQGDETVAWQHDVLRGLASLGVELPQPQELRAPPAADVVEAVRLRLLARSQAAVRIPTFDEFENMWRDTWTAEYIRKTYNARYMP